MCKKIMPRLIELAMARLEKDGLLIFSTNYRRFILEERLLSLYDIKDISLASVPYDFSRNEKIHQCWEIRKHGHTELDPKWPRNWAVAGRAGGYQQHNRAIIGFYLYNRAYRHNHE